MSDEPEMRWLRVDDAEAFAKHIGRHAAESGRDGDILFTPRQQPPKLEPLKERCERRWATPVGEPEWERCYALVLEGFVVGHCNLQSGALLSEQHRAMLGMGIERDFRGQGHGRRLMETVLLWAREQSGLEWIDLGVFSENTRARKLYEQHGFEEIGCTRDRFRVHGARVDDVQMVLKL
jgi:RimJ/RimL family protein N-acetyltransferase